MKLIFVVFDYDMNNRIFSYDEPVEKSPKEQFCGFFELNLKSIALGVKTYTTLIKSEIIVEPTVLLLQMDLQLSCIGIS